MKSTLIIFASLIIVLIATAIVTAQPGLPSNPAQAPIDGGLGLLAAAGGTYAYKKLRGNRNEKEGLN